MGTEPINALGDLREMSAYSRMTEFLFNDPNDMTPEMKAAIIQALARMSGRDLKAEIIEALVQGYDIAPSAIKELNNLSIVPEIKTITIDAHHGLLEVEATSNVETQIKLACDVAGTVYRRQIKNREFK